jgi:putative oxidoreductase
VKYFLNSSRYRDFGLMLLRVVLGGFFIYYGSGKILNPNKWAWLGSQVPFLGFEPLNYILGFMAAVAEFFGGVCLVLGLYTRIACIFMTMTMTVAVYYHAFVAKWSSLPMLYALLFLAIYLIGPDRFSLDSKINPSSSSNE